MYDTARRVALVKQRVRENTRRKRRRGIYGLSAACMLLFAVLMQAAGILEYENVQIVDIENGNRFETYTIAGEPGSGMICLNGAAARQVQVGDHVIIMAYCQMDAKEAADHKPKVVFVDEENHISRVSNYEKHGQLS